MLRNERFTYGLDPQATSPWIRLSERDKLKYSTPLKPPRVLQAKNTAVRGICVDESQGILACALSDRNNSEINIWNLLSGKITGAYRHDNFTNAVVIWKQGLAISGGWDKKIKLWDCLSNNLVKVIEAPGSVEYLAINPKSKLLAAGIGYSQNVQVIVWDLDTFQKVAEISNEGSISFESLSFDNSGKLLHARFGLGENRVWEFPKGKLTRAFPDSHYGEWTYTSIDERGRILATASDRGNEVYLWDTMSGRRVQAFEAVSKAMGGPYDPNIALNHNGSILITAALDGDIRIWATETKELLQEFSGNHKNEISKIYLNKKYLITGDHDGYIKIWEFKD
jgi:WD40 repeat protein